MINSLSLNDVRLFTAAGDITMVAEGAVVVKKAVGAATQVTLPANPADNLGGNFRWVIDGKGDAATNNITVVASSGNINGAASYVIDENYGAVLLFYPNGGTEWLAAGGFRTAPLQTGYAFQINTRGKVGGSAGWVVGAANDLPYVATMAASQTAGTLVVPIDGLHVGDTITGFRVVAQVESAGGIVTIDADLRAVTNVAADPTDASIGTMTQVSVTADTAVSQAKTGLTEVVASGKTYYLLITATTAASTDIILQSCEVTVTRT